MKFYVNKLSKQGGPGIFGYRLTEELVQQGHTRSIDPDLNISIIEGKRIREVTNALRIDGIYFDSGMSTRERINGNKPIVQSADEHDILVFQSYHSKRLWEGFYEPHDCSVVIHNGVPSAFHSGREKHKHDRPYFVASASWRRHKRLEEIVAAFASPKLKDFDLIVLGGADYTLEETEYIDSLPSNVKMFPMVPVDELPAIYRGSCGMIHLCWLDSCPNTVVEALSCGTPVLCSSNGGTKELVMHNGIVLELEDRYEYGTLVDLYNPPPVDIDAIVYGILDLWKVPSGFRRPDLDISTVATNYSRLLHI